jgi:hypothetical protein
MHYIKYAILPLLFLASFSHSSADSYTYLIRYEAEPEFSRIVISWDELRGIVGVNHMRENVDAYESKGVYDTHLFAKKTKTVTKVENMDGHEVKTVIKIQYPRGLGFGGACSWNYVKVYFDGALAVDVPFGYNHYTSMTVSKVIIYVDEEMITAKWRDTGSTEEYHFPTRSDGEVFRLPQR